MFNVNENFQKLAAGYLFPEIERRVRAFLDESPANKSTLIRCGIGDVTEPLPDAVVRAMKEAIDDLARRETFHGYGPPTGYEFLREPIARVDYRDRGLDVSPDEIFISDGSKIDCGAILDILANNGANRIAVADPVYPVYVDTNVMAGNTGPAREGGGYEGLVYLPATEENGFVPDVPKRSEEPVDVIYLCSPNNPTGAVATREELARWIEYAREAKALLLFDAAYEAFVRDPNLPRSIYEIDGARECAIEFRSFSKNGGFTGVRCGFTVVPKSLEGFTKGGERVPLHPLWARRWATKGNGVSYPVQRGAAAIYTDEGRAQTKALVEFYLGNARVLLEGCRELGLVAYGGENAPYVWVKCPQGVGSWAMFDRMLRELNVIVTPGAGFGRCGEGFFRISAFNSRENVEEVVRRMGDAEMAGVGRRASGTRRSNEPRP